MAVTKGSAGTVYSGSDLIAEVKSYSVDESAVTINTTELSDSAQTYVAGTTTFTGSVDVFWDPDDTGQGTLTAGASITLNLYPEGNTSGNTYYTGSVIITGISRSTSVDGTVDATISFQGSGALTETTV
jgi:hypothetical protein